MPAIRTSAFFTAPLDAVLMDPWVVLRGEDEERLGDDLPAFDPGGRLELRRRLVFDPDAVMAACDLGSGGRIAAVALWSSRLTGLKGASQPATPQAGSGTRDVELRLSLAGGDLGGALVLRTVLLLDLAPAESRPLAAHLPGSILWEGEPRHVVDLEGTGTRFPTELRVFGDRNGFPSRAAWYLDWDRDDMSLPVLGSIRLYLNQAHPMMGSLAGGTEEPDILRVRETLKFDLARELITGALANREFLADPGAFDAGSVGATIRRLCTRVLFPQWTLDELARGVKTAPARFDAELQAALELYWNPTA